MLNVPDYVLEEELAIHTDNKVSVDEPVQPRCSDFKMPLFTSETFINLISEYVSQISIEQWNFLAFGKIDSATFYILADLCEGIVDMVFVRVLDAIEPQCVFSRDSANASVTTDKTKAPQRKCNLRGVTEEDIKTSLGDSLNQCMGEVMGVTETKTSKHSEQLRQLVAGEAARWVNYRLGVHISSSMEKSVVMEMSESLTKKTVRNIRQILTQNMFRRNCSETVDRGLSQSSNQDEMSSEDSQCSDSSMIAMPPSSTEEELSQEEKNFLTVLLTKLLDNITQSTKIAILAFDYDRISKLLMKTIGETSLPATCGNLPHAIFKNLCQKFGSARLVQAAIIYDDIEFAEALARELKSQLKKMSRKPPCFFTKVGSFFIRASNKVVPACENDTLLSQRHIVHIEKNGSTPLGQTKERCPTIVKMFSAMVQCFKKPFTSSVSDGCTEAD